jgi:FlgD Ig-like domain
VIASSLGFLIVVASLGVAGFAPAAADDDPLIPMIRRTDRYLQNHEVDGVVMDWRVIINASEAARLSVVPQLLAYTELYRVRPSRRILRDIRDRADYLLANYDQLYSASVFNGMLGYALFEAYEATGDPRYQEKALAVIAQLERISHSEYVLNGGLMAAMAFAKHHALTGDPESLDLAGVVLASLPAYQHVDGSFPHWCYGSKDVHYTDWMSTELILIDRLIDHPLIDPMLDRIVGFMEQRVDATGNTSYQAPCDDYEGCVQYYYSIATGCEIDVDSRAFTNELGYSVLLFDHAGSQGYLPVMRFLKTLERGGTWRDKWDLWPPPDDPYYVWTAAETSVVNTSLLFWSLASTLAGRRADPLAVAAWDPDDPGAEFEAADPDSIAIALRPGGSAPIQPSAPRTRPDIPTPASGPSLRIQSVRPNPVRDGCTFEIRLGAVRPSSVVLFDASGRRVRRVLDATLSAGVHPVPWDGLDDDGQPCGSGVYFVRVTAGEDSDSRRVLVVR